MCDSVRVAVSVCVWPACSVTEEEEERARLAGGGRQLSGPGLVDALTGGAARSGRLAGVGTWGGSFGWHWQAFRLGLGVWFSFTSFSLA